MGDDTFVLWGVKFAVEEWGGLTGNFLILVGIALTLYIALFFGHEEEPNFEARGTKISPQPARKRSFTGENFLLFISE